MTEPEFDQPGLAEAFSSAMGRPSEAVQTEQTTTEAQTQTEDTPPPVTTETKEVATDIPPPAETFNKDEYISTLTGGKFKDEESIKARITGYEELETKVKDLEQKVPKYANEESQKLYEAWTSGNKEEVVKYIQETQKDYKTMSDIDVRREDIAKQNPSWSKQEVELEIRATYGDSLEIIDLSTIEKLDEDGKITDEYREAVQNNKEAERNAILLARDARDSRHKLIEQQSKIELPTINKDEVAQPVNNQPDENEIRERTRQWQESVKVQLPKMTDAKMVIDDKEVVYNWTAEERKEAEDYMMNFNIVKFAQDSGWYNEDGTPNVLKITEDRQFLKNREKIFKSYATQVKTDAKKGVLKDIKNIPDETRTPEIVGEHASLAEAFLAARSEKGW